MIEQATTGASDVHDGRPGLGFKVANTVGAPVVYITNDPNQNTLAVTITNQTGAAVTLKHGTPVPEEQLTAQGPTSLYLNFGGLLTDDQLKALHVDAPDWQSTCFVGPVVKSWALTPQADIRLGDGASIVVTVAHLTVSGQPGPAALTVDYLNVPTVNDDSFQQVLAVQTPPTQHRTLALGAEFASPSVVYVTSDVNNPIMNTLVLSIANPSQDGPIVPSTTPPGTDPPVFFLSFVYGKGDGYGALTTIEKSNTIQVDPMDHTTDTWKPERVDAETGSYWRLTPQQHDVLAAGGRVGFTISHIISELKPETLPTQLYLQWAHIPGYDDGHLSLDVYKNLPTPGILGFRSLTPEIITAGDPVRFTWQTFAAARVQLSYTLPHQAVVFDSRNGPIGTSMAQFAPTPLPVITTTFNLDAFDASGVKLATKQITVTVMDPPIKIDWFRAAPPGLDLTSGPVDIQLTWSITPNYLIKRLEVEGQGIVTGHDGYVVRGVKEPTTFVLRAIGLGKDETTASVQARSLHEYLVGRRFQGISTVIWDNPKKLVMDTLEFHSATEAHFTSVVLISDPYLGDHRDVTGSWSLVGSKIHLATSDPSVGTLVFYFQLHSKKGEAVYFENPPFLTAYGDGYDRLMI